MGEPKQLLCYNGETLLRRAVRTALDSKCRPVIVVLGAHANALRAEIADTQAHVAINPAWHEGLSSSIRCGIAALEAITAGSAQATVLMLCDQPFIAASVVNRLLETYAATGSPLVASEYEVEGERTRGVPALFSRTLFHELMKLRGQEGAKRVIAQYALDAVVIAAHEAAFDVDTPHDYQLLRSKVTGEN